MAFCANCGTQMGDGVKFCPSCGTQAGGAAPARPEKEKVGNIRKCPSCGAEVPSMTVACPECGHEFNQVEVAASVKNFTESLLGMDKENHIISRGNMMVLFIISLILFFLGMCCIAAGASEFPRFPGAYIPYFLLALFLIGSALLLLILPKPKMTQVEKQKISLVENFVVPNTREELIEFFTFAATQIDEVGTLSAFLSFEAKYKKIWSDIWKRKCRQTYAKARVAMATSDPASFALIKDIMQESKIS
jgi:RNA polymerase subunit RPABC4/transcription elongation factor Spt4